MKLIFSLVLAFAAAGASAAALGEVGGCIRVPDDDEGPVARRDTVQCCAEGWNLRVYTDNGKNAATCSKVGGHLLFDRCIMYSTGVDLQFEHGTGRCGLNPPPPTKNCDMNRCSFQMGGRWAWAPNGADCPSDTWYIRGGNYFTGKALCDNRDGRYRCCEIRDLCDGNRCNGTWQYGGGPRGAGSTCSSGSRAVSADSEFICHNVDGRYRCCS